MSQIEKTDSPYGVLFSVDGRLESLAEEARNEAPVNRLRAIISNENRGRDEALQELLQLGTDWLEVEHAHLTRFDVADGIHEIAEVSGPHPAVARKETRDSSRTFCRRVLSENAVLAVQNAAEEGWGEDPAYEEFGFSTYLGTKVLVGGTFYGTLCLVDRQTRESHFTKADAAAAVLLAKAAGKLLDEHPRERQQEQPTVAQLRALFDHSPNMINIHDEVGTLIAPNPHLCEKTGYREEELTGMKVWELDQEATPEAARALWSEMEPGDHSRWEGTYQCKDGSTFPVEVDLRRLDVEGQARFIATGRDISERREAEHAFRQSEKLHRETLRNITDAVLIAKDDGTLTYVCPNVAHIFGYDQREAEDLGTISALLGGDPLDEHDFDGEQEITNVEWQIADAEGTLHDLLVNIRRVSIQKGSRMYTCRDVTERKERERQLEAVFEQTYQFTGLLGPDGTLIRANETALQFGGLEEEDVIGQPVWETYWFQMGSETKERLRASVRRAAEGEFVRYEETVQGADESRVIDFSLRPVVGEDGEVTHIIPEGRDITERIEASQELRETKQLLEKTFESLSEVVLVVDPSEREIITCNAAVEEVFGHKRKELIGESTKKLHKSPETYERFAAIGEPILDAEGIFRHEYQMRRKDGEVIDTEHVVTPLQDENWPGVVVGVIRDVTEQKAQERTLARRRALLEAQAESTLDGLLAVDVDRNVTFLNDRFLELWDLSRAAIDRARPKPPDEQVILEKISGLLSDPEAFRKEVEYLHAHPDKESRDVIRLTDGRWLDRYSAPIVGSDREHFGRLWTFRDVTEQRRMMERLLAVQEEERRRIDQEIHDEMGGLLTSIQFNVGLAHRTAEEHGTPPDHFDQLQDLVDDLATVSRTISRKLYPSDLSEHGLVAGLRSVVDEIERKRDLDIDFYSEVEAEERFSTLIERTVCWIVQEALLKIGPHDDSEAAQVIVSTKGKQLHLHVFDQEAGLTSAAPNKEEDSFELEAIRRRAVWLDGNVRVDSIPDEGIRLSVTLPARLPFLDRMTECRKSKKIDNLYSGFNIKSNS